LKHLFEKKGFWGLLLFALIAVTAITAGAILSTSTQQEVDLNSSETLAAKEEVETTRQTVSASAVDASANSSKEETTAAASVEETTGEVTEETTEEVVDSSVTVLQFRSDSTLEWPIEGRVLLEYNMDNTIYFPSLDSYRCNPAVVIQGDADMPVMAACNGVVTQIGSNEEIGNYVTMDIGDGYTITYGQLSQLNLNTGQAVRTGDFIATLAEPTAYYETEGYNLYLKMTKDDVPIDPLDYLDYETE
jgi:murein DD-endopeptidase MepM/ murein hydrolase activator NlpD